MDADILWELGRENIIAQSIFHGIIYYHSCFSAYPSFAMGIEEYFIYIPLGKAGIARCIMVYQFTIIEMVCTGICADPNIMIVLSGYREYMSISECHISVSQEGGDFHCGHVKHRHSAAVCSDI